MATELAGRYRGRRMPAFRKIPWTLTLILYMLIVYWADIDMSGVAGYIFIGLSLFALFMEFYKSGDINTTAFLVDLTSAVVSVIVATALMVLLIGEADQGPTFFHWFGCVIILGDAILSPYNSFRTALRNFGVGHSDH